MNMREYAEPKQKDALLALSMDNILGPQIYICGQVIFLGLSPM
jgi:hypothetical protein